MGRRWTSAKSEGHKWNREGQSGGISRVERRWRVIEQGDPKCWGGGHKNSWEQRKEGSKRRRKTGKEKEGWLIKGHSIKHSMKVENVVILANLFFFLAHMCVHSCSQHAFNRWSSLQHRASPPCTRTYCIQHICQFCPTKVIHSQTQHSVCFTVNIRFLSAPSSRALGAATRQAAGLCSGSLRGQRSCRFLSCLPRAWGASRLTAGPNAEARSDHLSGPRSQSIAADMTLLMCFSLS